MTLDLRNQDQGRYKTFSRRAAMIAGGQGLLFTALAGRLYYLQVVEADRFATLAEDNRINLRLLPPPRGRIFDRAGVELAVNERNYRVVLVAERAGDVERTLSALEEIIEVSDEDRKRIHKELRRNRGFVPVMVQENLTWEEVSRIELNAPDLPGAGIEIGQVRHYPHGTAMGQVLGYIAPVSEKELDADPQPVMKLPDFRIGKSGIEKVYDLKLRGAAGRSHVEVNALGRIMKEVEREEATPGDDVLLTIDAALQEFTYKRLQNNRSASAVVMDVHSGEVYALASWPSFDPNEFHVGISGARWRELINDPLAPLSNKSITGLYAPGSTFKVLVALAALEAGIDPSKTHYCNAEWRLGRALFHCWKKQGHGRMDLRNAIKHSCDIYFYNVAKQLGIDRIADMAMRFGLGDITKVDLPNERGGLIPTRAWKEGAIGEKWQGGETVITAIGQGFVLTTPLQLAVMTARLVNGGFAVEPRMMRAEDPPLPAEPEATEEGAQTSPYGFPSIGIPQAHLEQVLDAMDAVVNEWRGTAYGKRIEEEGMEMGGKTGTSQVRRITLKERATGVKKNEEKPWRFRDHALFIGYAPVHKPQYACAVVVEHGGGGSKAAAPIAKDILLETQKRNPAGIPMPEIADAPPPTGSGPKGERS